MKTAFIVRSFAAYISGTDTEFILAQLKDLDAEIPIEKLLAEFYGIDLQKCEEEKLAILESIREAKTA